MLYFYFIGVNRFYIQNALVYVACIHNLYRQRKWWCADWSTRNNTLLRATLYYLVSAFIPQHSFQRSFWNKYNYICS